MFYEVFDIIMNIFMSLIPKKMQTRSIECCMNPGIPGSVRYVYTSEILRRNESRESIESIYGSTCSLHSGNCSIFDYLTAESQNSSEEKLIDELECINVKKRSKLTKTESNSISRCLLLVKRLYLVNARF